ncbi:MAG: preprotein translocase subunit TatB [Rhodobacteraceae bacterium]|nr:preprotein translocase subunit TatB [Paracoccaceae bacterium]
MSHDLDTRGLLCPLPVLKTRKRLKPLKSGEILSVLTDDPAAIVDFPHYCSESGNVLIDIKTLEDGSARFLVKKS